jgi:AraC-like DNA-binding protein
MLLALLVHVRDRQAVRAAVPATIPIRFVARAADLARSWPEGEPTAMLAELVDAEHASSVRALAAFHRRAPTVPVCAYIPLTIDAVRQVVQLTVRRVVMDVIVMPGDDLRAQLRRLLDYAHVRGETAALRFIWHRWETADVRDIVGACITMSGGAASVGDVARRLNRSARTLERQVAQAGLPPAHSILGWCRLLRAAYRLDRPEATVKEVAAMLGYPSPHAFAQHLQRHATLTLAELRAVGFRGLAAHVQAELLTTRALEKLRTHESAQRHA